MDSGSFDDQTCEWGLDMSPQKIPIFPQKRHCQKFFKLEDELREQNLPFIDAFLKCGVRGTKANPGKLGS